jgi:hypothetical protein
MYYKDTDNKLHWLDSSEFEHLLPTGSLQITDAEAESIQVPDAPTVAQQILALEATVTPRRLRDAVLTPEGKIWLEDIESKITTLRQEIKN